MNTVSAKIMLMNGDDRPRFGSYLLNFKTLL